MKKTLLAALLALSPVQASAQIVRAGGEFQVNTYTTTAQGNDAQQPAIAFDAKGGFVVMWDQFALDGSNYGVFGRRFDAAAVPRGAEFQVNTYTTGIQGQPNSVGLASGRVIVTWQDRRATNDSWGRFYNAGGGVTAPTQLSPIRTDSFSRLGMAAAADGSFVVAHLGFPSGQPEAVFVRRFDGAGAPRGDDFRVNTYTTVGLTTDVAVAPGGDFIVVWSEERPTPGILQAFGQRFSAAGALLGTEFQVIPSGTHQFIPAVAVAADGGFVVVWNGDYPPNFLGQVTGRVYLPSGVPAGPPFAVAESTTVDHFLPDLAMNASGDFVVAWQQPSPGGDTDIVARRFTAAGVPRGGEFRANTYTTGAQSSATVASDAAGNFIVAWRGPGPEHRVQAQRFGGLVPSLLAVNEAGNGVLEPGELADVAPSWRNVSGAARTFAATATFTGPPALGVSYSQVDGTGDYGTVADGAAGRCTNCYTVSTGFGGVRPATHWDAVMTEAITPDDLGQKASWAIHLGNSFTDVPASSGFYRFVETMLHRGITGGCGAAQYCPTASTGRDQMAVFVLLGKEGPGYLPPACGTTPLFADVPPSSPFCRWVEELAHRGVVTGCGGSNYCPSSPVTRDQLAVFVLRVLDPSLNPPSCVEPTLYADVPASDPFCRWIEELTRRGVVNGCGGGNYCPSAAVTREQMAVFIGATFGLTVYGP